MINYFIKISICSSEFTKTTVIKTVILLQTSTTLVKAYFALSLTLPNSKLMCYTHPRKEFYGRFDSADGTSASLASYGIWGLIDTISHCDTSTRLSDFHKILVISPKLKAQI